MKKIILLCLFALFSGAIHAQMMFGNVDCGRWVKNQTAINKTWVAGFVSGLSLQYAATNPNARDPLGDLTSFEQINVWLDNWCRDNPLKDASIGLYFMFEQLKKK